MSTLRKPFLDGLTALSAFGLALSFVSHLASLLGGTGPLGGDAWVLHIGIFVVWIPAIFVSRALTKGVPQKDFWKATLRGCPPWMRWMVTLLFGYALLNFILLLASRTPAKSSGPMTPWDVYLFSGHWMIFYAAAMATFYSAAHLDNASPRCIQGHSVSPHAKFCDQCGQPVVQAPRDPAS